MLPHWCKLPNLHVCYYLAMISNYYNSYVKVQSAMHTGFDYEWRTQNICIPYTCTDALGLHELQCAEIETSCNWRIAWLHNITSEEAFNCIHWINTQHHDTTPIIFFESMLKETLIKHQPQQSGALMLSSRQPCCQTWLRASQKRACGFFLQLFPCFWPAIMGLTWVTVHLQNVSEDTLRQNELAWQRIPNTLGCAHQWTTQPCPAWGQHWHTSLVFMALDCNKSPLLEMNLHQIFGQVVCVIMRVWLQCFACWLGCLANCRGIRTLFNMSSLQWFLKLFWVQSNAWYCNDRRHIPPRFTSIGPKAHNAPIVDQFEPCTKKPWTNWTWNVATIKQMHISLSKIKLSPLKKKRQRKKTRWTNQQNYKNNAPHQPSSKKWISYTLNLRPKHINPFTRPNQHWNSKVACNERTKSHTVAKKKKL